MKYLVGDVIRAYNKRNKKKSDIGVVAYVDSINRRVAVFYVNGRRASWTTDNLERDYNIEVLASGDDLNRGETLKGINDEIDKLVSRRKHLILNTIEAFKEKAKQ